MPLYYLGVLVTDVAGSANIASSFSPVPLNATLCSALADQIRAAFGITTDTFTKKTLVLGDIGNLSDSHIPVSQVSSSSPFGFPVVFTSVFPLLVRLPGTASAGVSAIGTVSRSIALLLNGTTSTGVASPREGPGATAYSAMSAMSLWWTVASVTPETSDLLAGQQPMPSGGSLPGLTFNVISDRVAPPIVVAALGSSYSVLAVYLTVVLAGG